MEIRKPEYVFRDDRGELAQIISGGPWRQMNILKRRAGSFGGGHYHTRTEEVFYVVSGRLEVRIFDTVSNSHIESRTFADGDCFVVMPYEQHYMNFLTDTVLVALYTNPFNQQETDVLVDDKLPSINEIFGSPKK